MIPARGACGEPGNHGADCSGVDRAGLDEPRHTSGLAPSRQSLARRQLEHEIGCDDLSLACEPEVGQPTMERFAKEALRSPIAVEDLRRRSVEELHEVGVEERV